MVIYSLCKHDFADPDGTCLQCEMEAEMEQLQQRNRLLESVIRKIKGSLVIWRCINCRHDQIEITGNEYLNTCPKCGTESNMHQTFSDDRDGLIEALKELNDNQMAE